MQIKSVRNTQILLEAYTLPKWKGLARSNLDRPTGKRDNSRASTRPEQRRSGPAPQGRSGMNMSAGGAYRDLQEGHTAITYISAQTT